MSFDLLGRLHPLIVHLPIGILLLALLMEVYRGRSTENDAGVDAMRRSVWLIGAATAVFSCVTGLILEREGDHAQRLTDRHKWSALVTTLLACIGYAATFAPRGGGYSPLLRRSLRTGVLAGILLTGHYGGGLTHGEDYLTSAFRRDGNEADVETAPTIRPVTDSSVVYSDVVAPILQSRCVECHGASKQKGGLRLDGVEAILEGGREGPVLVKGDPEASELYRRLRLPMDDEHHMPPPKKPQPTEQEMRLLHWWILNGHDFKSTVSRTPADSQMRGVLTALSSSGAREAPAGSVAPEWPSGEVPEADPNVLAGLRKSGIMVLPVIPGKPFLQASLLNATVPADSAARLLSQVSKQLVWLKADVEGLTDEGCAHLAKLGNLSRLSLAGSSVTDKGIACLALLDGLRSLNLSGTAVTEKGLRHLGAKPTLERLYLHGTPVHRDSVRSLAIGFPSAKIDTGGYRLPSLPSDTQRREPR